MMEATECEFADIDGLKVRIRRKQQREQAAQAYAPQVGAKSGPAPEDGWKDFVDPAQWQIVEESMQRYAYAKKLGSAALQQLTVRENEPAHVKIAALHKSLLHQASADAEDPAVAKALVTIAATYPSALAKIAARHAEEQAVPRIDPVADLRSKARTCQAALAERLHELQEETRRYRSLHRNMNELKQMNTEIEASLAEASKQRAALAANNAFVDANSRIEADTVDALAKVAKEVDKTVWSSQAVRKELEAWFNHKQALRFPLQDPFDAINHVP